MFVLKSPNYPLWQHWRCLLRDAGCHRGSHPLRIAWPTSAGWLGNFYEQREHLEPSRRWSVCSWSFDSSGLSANFDSLNYWFQRPAPIKVFNMFSWNFFWNCCESEQTEKNWGLICNVENTLLGHKLRASLCNGEGKGEWGCSLQLEANFPRNCCHFSFLFG